MPLCPLTGDKEQAYQSLRQGLHSSFKHIQINRLLAEGCVSLYAG